MLVLLAQQFSYRPQFREVVQLHSAPDDFLVLLVDMTPEGEFVIYDEDETLEELQAQCSRFRLEIPDMRIRVSYLPYVYDACELKIEILKNKRAKTSVIVFYDDMKEFEREITFIASNDVKWQSVWGVFIVVFFILFTYLARYISRKKEERIVAYTLYHLIVDNRQRRLLKTAVQQSFAEVFDYKRYYCLDCAVLRELRFPRGHFRGQELVIDGKTYVANVLPINPQNCNVLIEAAARVAGFSFYAVASFQPHQENRIGELEFDTFYTYEDIFEKREMESRTCSFFVIVVTSGELDELVSIESIFEEAQQTLEKYGLCNFLRLDYMQQCQLPSFFPNFDKLIELYEAQFSEFEEPEIQSQLNQTSAQNPDNTKSNDMRLLVEKELQRIDQNRNPDLSEVKQDNPRLSVEDVLSVESGAVDEEVYSMQSCGSNTFRLFDFSAKQELPAVELNITGFETAAKPIQTLQMQPFRADQLFPALQSGRANHSNESETDIEVELPQFELPNFDISNFGAFGLNNDTEMPEIVLDMPNFDLGGFGVPETSETQALEQNEDTNQLEEENDSAMERFEPEEQPIFPPLQSEIPSCNPYNPPISLASPVSVSLELDNEIDIFAVGSAGESTLFVMNVANNIDVDEATKSIQSQDHSSSLLDQEEKTELKNPFDGFEETPDNGNSGDLFSVNKQNDKPRHPLENLLKLDIGKINSSLSDLILPAHAPSSEREPIAPLVEDSTKTMFSPLAETTKRNIAPPSTEDTPRLFPETAAMLNRFSQQMYRTSHSVKSPSSISSASMSVNNWYTDASEVDPKKLYDIIEESASQKNRSLRQCKTGKTDLLPLMPFPITKSLDYSLFPLQTYEVPLKEQLIYVSPFDLLCQLPESFSSLLIASGPLFRLKFAIYCVFTERLDDRLGFWGITLLDERVTLLNDDQQVTFKCKFVVSKFAELGMLLQIGRNIGSSVEHLPAEKRRIIGLSLELASFVYLTEVTDIAKIFIELKQDTNNEIAAAILRVALCETVAEVRDVLLSILEVIEQRRKNIEEE